MVISEIFIFTLAYPFLRNIIGAVQKFVWPLAIEQVPNPRRLTWKHSKHALQPPKPAGLFSVLNNSSGTWRSNCYLEGRAKQNYTVSDGGERCEIPWWIHWKSGAMELRRSLSFYLTKKAVFILVRPGGPRRRWKETKWSFLQLLQENGSWGSSWR